MTAGLKRSITRMEASQAQADLYRRMADKLDELIDPKGPATVLGVEIERLLTMADELDSDADETFNLIVDNYTPEEYEAARMA